MKKLFVLLMCAGFFTACNNYQIYDDNWENAISGLEQTDLSITEVMQSADCWKAWPRYYTQPNGKGEEYQFGDIQEDGTVVVSGLNSRVYAFEGDHLRVYAKSSHPSVPHCYYDLEMSEIVDNKFSVGESRWKIIDYDDDNILVETENFNSKSLNGIDYPYSIILFSKLHQSDPNWKDKYLPPEEYEEAIKGLFN